MKSLTLLALTLVLSVPAYAFKTSDEFLCSDSVSRYTYEIKILDRDNELAQIKVLQRNKLKFFYGPKSVIFKVNREGAQFTVLDLNGNYKEEIFLEKKFHHGKGFGIYMDLGDSRHLDCTRKK